jgi:hypothetical protein
MPTIITRGAASARAFGFGASGPSGYTYKWVFTQNGASSFKVPTGVTSMTVEAIGSGAGGSTLATGGGGGAGAYAKSVITTTPGGTVYFSVGYSITDSWVNQAANSAPSSSANGVLAKAGVSATSATGGAGGSAATSVGTTTYAGGAGGNGSVGRGGGGGAASSTGAGNAGGSQVGPSANNAGGGGVGGGSSSAGSANTAVAGGAGGNGPLGTGGGTGATTTVSATGGTNGGGGGGTGTVMTSGGNSSVYDLWGGNYGPASGGGGGASSIIWGGGNGGGTAGGYNGIIVVTFTLAAQAEGQTVKFGQPGTSPYGAFNSPTIAGIDSLGNQYVVATSPAGGFLIAKVSPRGSLLWQRALTDATLPNASSPSAVLDSSNNLYVVGIFSAATSSYFLAKYNSSGTIQWQRKLTGATSNLYSPAIVLDSAGNIWVGGGDTSSKWILAKYNTSGTLLAGYKRPVIHNYPIGMALTADPAGYLYMWFSEYDSFAHCCCGCISYSYETYSYVYKYDNSLTFQWGNRDNTASNGNTSGVFGGMAVDSSSNMYMSIMTNAGYVAMAKFDSAGSVTWCLTISNASIAFGGPNGQIKQSLVLDSSNNIYVYASLQGAIWKVNSTGTTQYIRTFDGFTVYNGGSGSKNSTNYFVGSYAASFKPTYISWPFTGLATGNYGPYTVGNASATYSTSNFMTSSSTSTAWTSYTWTDVAGSFTDASATATTIVGWL